MNKCAYQDLRSIISWKLGLIRKELLDFVEMESSKEKRGEKKILGHKLWWYYKRRKIIWCYHGMMSLWGVFQ